MANLAYWIGIFSMIINECCKKNAKVFILDFEALFWSSKCNNMSELVGIMTFTGAIKSGFNNYVTFKGRASRSEFWYWTLFLVLLSMCTTLIDIAAFFSSAWAPTGTITTIITLLPSYAMSVRRLHDVNRSGWWNLIALTGIGIFVLLYWTIKNSDQAENSYGE